MELGLGFKNPETTSDAAKKNATAAFQYLDKEAKRLAAAAAAAAGDGPLDAEMEDEDMAMIRVGKQAQLEHVRNSIVLGKRSDLDYRTWLKRSMPGDYDNEFVSMNGRKNERLHALWGECGAGDQLVHHYTTTDNEIDAEAVEAAAKQLTMFQALARIRGKLRIPISDARLPWEVVEHAARSLDGRGGPRFDRKETLSQQVQGICDFLDIETNWPIRPAPGQPGGPPSALRGAA